MPFWAKIEIMAELAIAQKDIEVGCWSVSAKGI